MRFMTKTAMAALIGISFGAAAFPAQAEFPEKPIKLTIPFRAGGGSDGLARVVQSVIEKENLLPAPVVVVNADGAAGTIGTRHVLESKPDGYTVLQIHQEMFAAAALGRVNYSPADFEPVIQASQGCMFVAVPIDSDFDSLQDMLDYAAENPGDIKQADDIGSATHFPSAQLMAASDTSWTIVPTGGTSKRFAALKSGLLDMAFMSASWIKRGKEDLKPLAALGNERFDDAPDLPTAKELGFDVEACLNRRYWVPAGTPQENIDILADAIEAALKSPEVAQYLEKNGETLSIKRGQELKDAVAQDYQRYVDVVDIVKKSSAQ